MFFQLPTISSEANAGLILPEGVILADENGDTLYVHDGVTVGGYKAVGQRAYDPVTGPGPKLPIAGNVANGFFGEMPARDLFNFYDLVYELGLSAGSKATDAENIPWLKFAHNGKILYIPKRNLATAISWNTLKNNNLVYGETIINKGEDGFMVRLIKGADSDPALTPLADHKANSEWDRLLYRITTAAPVEERWANYSWSEVGLNAGTLCQETYLEVDNTIAIYRGGSSAANDIDYVFKSSSSSSYTGWRPVLEWVRPVNFYYAVTDISATQADVIARPMGLEVLEGGDLIEVLE